MFKRFKNFVSAAVVGVASLYATQQAPACDYSSLPKAAEQSEVESRYSRLPKAERLDARCKYGSISNAPLVYRIAGTFEADILAGLLGQSAIKKSALDTEQRRGLKTLLDKGLAEVVKGHVYLTQQAQDKIMAKYGSPQEQRLEMFKQYAQDTRQKEVLDALTEGVSTIEFANGGSASNLEIAMLSAGCLNPVRHDGRLQYRLPSFRRAS